MSIINRNKTLRPLLPDTQILQQLNMQERNQQLSSIDQVIEGSSKAPLADLNKRLHILEAYNASFNMKWSYWSIFLNTRQSRDIALIRSP